MAHIFDTNNSNTDNSGFELCHLCGERVEICSCLREEDQRASDLIAQIRVGSRVTILIPAGIGRQGIEYKEKTGRAVLRGPHGWVLNMGGRYGTPAVASESNIVRVKTTHKDLSPEQLAALQRVAKYYGRRWKDSLRQAWMTGQYGCYMDAPQLQQIRNTFGPSWLVRFKLPTT